MGRKIHVSQPTVINTELIPLNESFWIEADDQLDQWYYDNTGQYKPDRHPFSPLTLTPYISAFDDDTKQTYTPNFYTVEWYKNEYNTSTFQYVKTKITNTQDSADADWVLVGNTLKVKKNVSYSRAITITCRATYIDPRDSGITYSVEKSVILSTNRDASVIYPKLDVAAPDSRAFNPLVDETSQYTFTAIANRGGQDVTANVYFVWYAISGTTEVLANTMPWYVSGQNTSTLVVDALYGEDIRVILRAKENSSAATLYPDKVYRSLLWRIPDLDTHVVSKNGSAVRSSTKEMTFGTTINVRHNILSDEKKAEHLLFNWKTRRNNSSTEVNVGWGQEITLSATQLRNVIGAGSSLASTLVYPEIYVKGAYEVVTQDGVVVTQGGEDVYERSVYD